MRISDWSSDVCSSDLGLAVASGNRYFANAIQQQNRLRRFSNYDWVYGHERVVVSCSEHLEILDRLEAGERDLGAAYVATDAGVMNIDTFTLQQFDADIQTPPAEFQTGREACVERVS